MNYNFYFNQIIPGVQVTPIDLKKVSPIDRVIAILIFLFKFYQTLKLP